jgi:hypothetical protein
LEEPLGDLPILRLYPVDYQDPPPKQPLGKQLIVKSGAEPEMDFQIDRLYGRMGVALLLAIALLGLLISTVPVGPLGSTNAAPGTRLSPMAAVVNPPSTTRYVNLTNVTDFTTNDISSPEFYGVNVRADSNFTPEDALNLSDTSALTWRFPGGNLGEDYNYITNRNATLNFTVGHHEPNGISNFAGLCMTYQCHAILQLPAEINNSTIDANYVFYVENSLKYNVSGNPEIGFTPWLWEFGNEPALWTHFGISWNNWSTQVPAPNNTTYAKIVPHIIRAILSVDPTAAIDPLGGVGLNASYDVSWVNAVMTRIEGKPRLEQAVRDISIHYYPVTPWGGISNLSTFYRAAYRDPNTLQSLLPKIEKTINGSCPNCPTVGILISEAGASTNVSYTPLEKGFPMAMWDATEAIQSAESNVTSIDYFAYHNGYPGSFIASPSKLLDPSYFFFKDITPFLGSTVQKVTLSNNDSGMLQVGAYLGPGSNRSLLIVNLDTVNSTSINILNSSGFPLAGHIEVYTWAGGMPEPTGHVNLSLTSTTVGPNSMELITVYPGHPTRLLAPKGVFIASYNATQVQITYAQPPGPIVRDSIRYGIVAGVATFCDNNSSVRSVNTKVATAGWVVPGLSPGTQYCFSARTKTSAGFGAWSSWVYVTTMPVYRVAFKENGLPVGTGWSVTVGGTTMSSNGRRIGFTLTDSSYSYSVPNVTGYTNTGRGNFTLTGTDLTIVEHFSPIHYQVSFIETGLPNNHSVWKVTIGSNTYSTRGTTILVNLPNGTYTYAAGVPAGGYLASGGKFTVVGSAVRVTVAFT